MKVSKKIEKIKPNSQSIYHQNNTTITGQNHTKLLQNLKIVSDNSTFHKRNFSDIPKINEISPDPHINKPSSQDKQYQYSQKE